MTTPIWHSAANALTSPREILTGFKPAGPTLTPKPLEPRQSGAFAADLMQALGRSPTST